MLVDEIHRRRRPRQISVRLAGVLLGNRMAMTIRTRITTPFTHDSMADEVLAGVDLHGRRAIVTGATSGIGVETARALAAAGAEVTLAVRNLDAGERTAAEISSKTGNRRALVSHLDLTDR